VIFSIFIESILFVFLSVQNDRIEAGTCIYFHRRGHVVQKFVYDLKSVSNHDLQLCCNSFDEYLTN
jgi:hypothetical protein